MPSELPRYTLRIDAVLLEKLHYIAFQNDRSANKEIERVLRSYVSDFEKKNGIINTDNLQDKH